MTNPTIAQIKTAVAAEFGITALELTGTCRKAKFSQSRAIAAQLIRQFTKASYPMIGRELGGRHHSTIITLERRSHNLIATFPELYEKRRAIIAQLGLG